MYGIMVAWEILHHKIILTMGLRNLQEMKAMGEVTSKLTNEINAKSIEASEKLSEELAAVRKATTSLMPTQVHFHRVENIEDYLYYKDWRVNFEFFIKLDAF